MLNMLENIKIKKDIFIIKVGLWVLFGIFIVKKLVLIFVFCFVKLYFFKVLEMKESCGW